MNMPLWLLDINKHATGMPFGDIDVTIKRHRSKTAEVTYKTSSKIRYSDNVKAFSDLEKLINGMINAQFSGKLSLVVDFKKGTIELITVKNKDIKDYRG